MAGQSSERIQVGFSEVTLQAVKDLAESEGLKKARVCSILIEEALIARGLLHSTKMGERLPSSIRNIVPDDAITPPDPEPLTVEQVNDVFPPLTDNEKTEVIKETGQHPFTVNKPGSFSDQLRQVAEDKGMSLTTVTKKAEPLKESHELSFKMKKLQMMQDLIKELQSM